MIIDSKVLAVDPTDCYCTECGNREYVPLRNATDDHIQALFLGILADNTSAQWLITQNPDGGFTVVAGNEWDRDADAPRFTIEKVAFPITVEKYVLDVDLDTVVANLVHLRPRGDA